MDKSPDLAAVRIPDDEVDLYNVSEGGWYAVDEADKAVLGPFESLSECDRAIHDRIALVTPSASPATRAHIS
jgi:hypothetical protein